MTDMIAAAQRGNRDAQQAVWESVKRLAFQIANQYRNAAAVCSGVDAEDLAQCAALGVMEALRGYNPDKGSFTTYLGYHVRNACRECLGLSGRERQEHYGAISLDSPIGGDTEDLTVGDTIPDDDAALAFEQAEDAHDARLLRQALDAALDCLPDELADTIRLHDLGGLTFQEAADQQGIHCSTAATRRRAGFRRLRKNPQLQTWYSPNYHRHKTLSAFRHTWSSVVEDEVMRKLDQGI